MENAHAIAGKLAGILALAGFIPYIVSMLKGQTRPNRATWIIWGLVGAILLTSYKAAGASHALWVSVANVAAIGFIILLSFKYGEGGFNRLDIVCLGGALLGVLLWWYWDSPLPALYISLFIDLIGAIPTLKKSYLNPEGEDRLTWLLFWVANTLNLLALEEWSPEMAAYPVYLFAISGAILGLLLFQPRKARVF